MPFQSVSTHQKVGMTARKGHFCEASIPPKIFQCKTLLVNVH